MTEQQPKKPSAVSAEDIDLLLGLAKKGPTGRPIIDEELWATMIRPQSKNASVSKDTRSVLFPSLNSNGGAEQQEYDFDEWYGKPSLNDIQERIAKLRKRIENVEEAKKRDIARRYATSDGGVSFRIAVFKNHQSRELIDPVPADLMLRQAYAVVSVLQVIQHTIDDACKNPRSAVYIRKLSQESPINVDMNGVSTAFEVLRDSLVPWRREHQKVIAELDQLEKMLDLKVKEADVAEARAAAETRSAEAKKIDAETARILEEAKSLRLQNDEKRLELQKQTLQTAIDIVHRYAPALEPQEALTYALRLFPAFETIVTLPIDLRDVD